MSFENDGNGRITFKMEGRVDSTSSARLGEEIEAALDESRATKLTLDASDLEYISSAGLRVIMLLGRRCEELSVVNASNEVYDIFEMTGFTQIIDVRKRLRKLSVDGLHQIGAGANGRVYRLNDEQIIKVYNPITNPPEKIAREKKAAREALVLGIPTAFSFDLVEVGDSYGIIYEFVDARTLGETIARNPDRVDEYATRMARLLQELHATECAQGSLPDARLGFHAWADVAERSGYYTDEFIAQVRAFIDSIPAGTTFVHGDFQPANIMVTDEDELLLIDMGDASMGDPIIDLAGSFQIMKLVASHPGAAERYTSMPTELLNRVWNVFVRTYYGVDDDEAVAEIEQRLMFHALVRSLAGVTFSRVFPDDARRPTAARMVEAFQHGLERYGA